MGTAASGGSSITLSPMEIDAIGEVMNISMGSAATAVSQMLDRVVEITTPTVEVQRVGDVNHEQYEPALLVKIVYTVGLTGSNCMVFRQHDMQMILNALMGIADAPSDDFVFDELSISAACEVMNQMMGASATALADFLNKRIDISTPTAVVMERNDFLTAMDMPAEGEVVTITFRLTIKDMVDSEFVSVLNVDLVREIIAQFFGGDGQVALDAGAAASAPEPAAPAAEAAQTAASPAAAAPVAEMPAAAPMPAQAGVQPAGEAPPMAAAAMQQPPVGYPPMAGVPYAPDAAAMGGYPPQGYPYMPPPPMYAQPPPQQAYPQIDARPVEFPEFGQAGSGEGVPMMGNNLDLIMNVPLNVSIEIGTTKRKIRDIMNFTSGTVVELDKQAGSPVDIVVNGQLIAHGDVVVIDDNFGVRVTEIVGTKDLITSLSEQQKKT